MSRLKELLLFATELGLDRSERHTVSEVARTAYEEYVARHPVSIDHRDRSARECYEGAAWDHALAVGRQYIKEEVDKWHRRGYKNQADGAAQ